MAKDTTSVRIDTDTYQKMQVRAKEQKRLVGDQISIDIEDYLENLESESLG